MVSTSVSKTESPGSNPGTPAKISDVTIGNTMLRIDILIQILGVGNVLIDDQADR